MKDKREYMGLRGAGVASSVWPTHSAASFSARTSVRGPIVA